ncbi:MAG: PD-(D/E)XK nuclease family protein [Flavobacteriaceae bacterium]|nr:PD-(D/E)XK nuclease family protein [Flavobacteriaceae bacterium]MCY4267460.1 PD-(D/E)XK nuclease family protein [Flavobacteriaceae bacterium]
MDKKQRESNRSGLMETFLKRVVQGIIRSKIPLNQSIIILPNYNAVHHFKQALASHLDEHVLDNNIMSFERFLFDRLKYQRIDSIELLYRFYSVYKRLAKEAPSDKFYNYLNWGDAILREFEEIDANNQSVRKIFTHLHQIKEIKELFENSNNPKHKKTIRDYKGFNELIVETYQELVDELREEKLAYYGMAVKEFSLKVEEYIKKIASHHYFIGFIALRKAEENILKKLLDSGSATVYWDIDKAFFHDDDHPAAYFLRKYINQWDYFKKNGIPTLGDFFNEKKEINVIALPKIITQTKCAAKIIKDHHQVVSSTALILGDESFLIPTLSGVSTLNIPWNANMGYALNETEVYTFFSYLIAMHENLDDHGYDFEMVLRLSKTCYLEELLQSYHFKIINSIYELKREYKRVLSFDKLKELNRNATYSESKSLFDLFFKPLKTQSSESQIKSLIEVCDFYLKEKLPQSSNAYRAFGAKRDPKIYYFQSFKRLFRKILRYESKYQSIESLSDLKYLISQLAATEKIEFADQPNAKVQIMGLLDSRLLDFDQVIITNLNEGVLPKGIKSGHWIPDEIRRQYGLTTYIEQDYFVTYHFFRVIQRASKIYLLYNQDASGFSSGEKSRLIRYLEYFTSEHHKPIKYPKIQLNTSQIPVNRSVKKNKQIMTQLENMMFGEGISATAVLLYLKNPVAFYERYVLGLYEPESIEFTIDPLKRGNVIHKVLEDLFKPYEGKFMKEQDYDLMMKNLDKRVLTTYRDIFGGDKITKGINYMFLEITTQHIKNYLKSERKGLKKGQRIKIITTEKKLANISIDVHSSGREIKIQGIMDRIDLIITEQGGYLRIIDYKLNKESPPKLKAVSDLFNRESNFGEKRQLQLLFYALLCHYSQGHKFHEYFTDDRVLCGNISMKKSYPVFVPLVFPSRKKGDPPLTWDRRYLEEYHSCLRDLLREILNPNIDFEYREQEIYQPN